MGAGQAGKRFSKEVQSKQTAEGFIEINQVTGVVGVIFDIHHCSLCSIYFFSALKSLIYFVFCSLCTVTHPFISGGGEGSLGLQP